ncbi:response regulator [Ancylomarina longa]|uniref:histidine kinase n=1 Tax=Ancylomarina longa TaxID=2487017 RepID=A0A434AZL4_9BACT|nr:response regulator [Ancylomarina longa]RUT80043.1 response regulator [Ancylomarina longa]
MGLDFTPELLIVDDREENLELLRALLGNMDVNLELIQSPVKALQRVESKEYALIILDIQMPQMDGFLLAEKIRKGKLNPSTPIIFLTAFYLDRQSELRGYKCGCSDFIIKPFDSTILISKVNVFLDLYKNRRIKEIKNEKLSTALNEKNVLEDRLRNLASNYRTILEGQRELIFKLDENLKIEFSNKAFSNFFNFTMDGVSLNSLAEISEELNSQLLDKVKEMNGNERTSEFEFSIRNYRSDLKWLEWSVFKDMEFDGLHYLVVGRDISDKRILKESMIRKEKLLEKTERSAKIGSWEWDSYSKILRGSDEFYRLYELEKGDSEHDLELIRMKTHPEDQQVINRILSNIPKKNRKLEIQHRIICANKSIKHFKEVVYCEYDDINDIINLYGLTCDISLHKMMEATFISSFNLDKESYHDKVYFELDTNYCIYYLNGFACDFFECEAANKSVGCEFIKFFESDDQERILKVLEHSTQNREFIFEQFTVATNKGNLKKVVLAAHVTSKEFKKGIRGILIEISDNKNSMEYQKIITNLKEKEKQFEESNLKLKEKIEKELEVNEFQRQLLSNKSELESLGKMAGSVVHEINQPLTGISMIMDNILLRLSMNKIDEEYLRDKCSRVFQDIDRIKKYLSQIGIFNSSQNIKESGSIDVNNTIMDAVEMVKKQYKNSDIDIKLEVNPESLYVCGNKYKLQKVIVDILNNSFESIGQRLRQEGHKEFDENIHISTEIDHDRLVIAIKDNGRGIDPENLNYIFEPFFTTKQTGIASGLGLYVSKDIIQKMNGEIAVHSTKNEFTEMKLILPFEKKERKKNLSIISK